MRDIYLLQRHGLYLGASSVSSTRYPLTILFVPPQETPSPFYVSPLSNTPSVEPFTHGTVIRDIIFFPLPPKLQVVGKTTFFFFFCVLFPSLIHRAAKENTHTQTNGILPQEAQVRDAGYRSTLPHKDGEHHKHLIVRTSSGERERDVATKCCQQ